MERYSEVHPSKWQSKYSEEFKRFICNEYLNGSQTRREIVARYKIGNSRLTLLVKEKQIQHPHLSNRRWRYQNRNPPSGPNGLAYPSANGNSF